jgi:glycosyltransferase involved in cell wall biosynthesis
VLAVLIGKLLRKKVIVTYHGGDALNYFKSNKLGLSVLRMAHKISVPSEYLHRVFETYSIKTEIIANIVDLQESAIIDKRIFKPALITTRSLQKIYNLETAIKVVHQLQKSYPEASLHIVGSGPEEENLKKQALQAGAKNIYFVGMVDNSRIYEILEKADFWCNPTTVDNVPVSLIEAANAGLVIITSNSGGIPYMVEHQQSAWITNSMDVEKMTAGIIYLLQHPQKANQLRKNAKERVKNYTWPSVREKLLTIYSELT